MVGIKVNRFLLQKKRFDIHKEYDRESLDNHSGIYAIVNLINGHNYIGQSVDLLQRKKDHFHSLASGKHKNPYLQNAANKYGLQNFRFTVLEFVARNELNDREQYWLEQTGGDYNIVRNVFQIWDKANKDDLPDGWFYVEGETFLRPDWHKYVYGGCRH